METTQPVTPSWSRTLANVFPGLSSHSTPGNIDNYIPLFNQRGNQKRTSKKTKKPRISCCMWSLVLGFLIMLGIIQFISITFSTIISFFPDELDRAADHWRHRPRSIPISPADHVSHWPLDIPKDIRPIACHSHNDYLQGQPLFSALEVGCISVEADVWLFDDDLYVAHTRSNISPQRTLRLMYIEPLVRILDGQNQNTTAGLPFNGVFSTDPTQTLVLLIDIKSKGATTLPEVAAQLSPLRERGYLTYFNGEMVIPGPVTVVGTGATPFDLLTTNPVYRDMFFDAPLDRLIQGRNASLDMDQHISNPLIENVGQDSSNTSIGTNFNATNSYYASVSFSKSIGYPWRLRFTKKQLDRVRAQVEAAHRQGLKARYWALPNWPRTLRDYVWSVLIREGVDIINVDDLEGYKNFVSKEV